MGRRSVLCARSLVMALNAAWPEPAAAQREDRPPDCTQSMSSAAIFIGHDCGEWASIMIVGRIEIKCPWSRTTRASRAVRIRERREGRTGGQSRPARAASADAPTDILALDVSGGSSPDPDCDDFATQAEAQEFFDAQGWTAENDPEGLDDAARVDDGAPCEHLP